MFKKLILSSFLFGNLFCNLPTMQEVMASGNPITIALYGAYFKYNSLQQQHPSNTKLLKIIGNDILLSTPWLSEKGFTALLQSSSEDDLIKKIESHECYSNLPKICQAYLKNNLLLAFRNLQ